MNARSIRVLPPKRRDAVQDIGSQGNRALKVHVLRVAGLRPLGAQPTANRGQTWRQIRTTRAAGLRQVALVLGAKLPQHGVI